MQGEYFPIRFRWHAPLAQSPTSLYKLLLPRDGSNWNEIYCLFEDQRNPKVLEKWLYLSLSFCPISGEPRPPAPSRPAAWSAASAAPWCIPLEGIKFSTWVTSIRSFCASRMTSPNPLHVSYLGQILLRYGNPIFFGWLEMTRSWSRPIEFISCWLWSTKYH